MTPATGAERLWLVRFMSGDTTVAGVFTEAPTILGAVYHCHELGLTPEGTDTSAEKITSPVDERWHDQFLTPAQISEALGRKP